MDIFGWYRGLRNRRRAFEFSAGLLQAEASEGREGTIVLRLDMGGLGRLRLGLSLPEFEALRASLTAFSLGQEHGELSRPERVQAASPSLPIEEFPTFWDRLNADDLLEDDA